MSDSLNRIVTMAGLLIDQQRHVEELKEELKKAEAKALRMEREDLPELMKELGLSEVTLEDGTKVTIREEFDAHISKAKAPEAHAWLISNGFGGLIKTAVSVTFAHGEHDQAVEAHNALAQKYGDVAPEEKVHPLTLKAFVREQLTAGAAVPFELFGVHPYDKAIIKRSE